MGAQRINFKVYIANGNFHIPLYQREFVWKSEQALNFIDEIIKLHNDEEDDKKIFCGTTYLKANSENTWDIIDGQQRTTFLYGLKLAISDRANELNKELDQYQSKTNKKLIEGFREILQRINSFEITTARSDKDNSFENQLKNGKGKIIKVFKDIKERIDGYISNDLKNDTLDTIEFINFLFTKVELIEVKIEETDDINDIFKSINSKGKKLSTWDIIRNDIYRNSTSGEETLQNIDDLLSVLEEDYYIKNEEFIQGYLMSQSKEYVAKSKILKFFDKVSKTKKPESINNDIEAFNNKLKKFDSDKSKNNVNFIKYFFKITKELGQTQIRTFSIAALLSWDFENEVPEGLKKLLVNSIIYVTLGKGRGNTIEKFLMQNSKDILESKEKCIELINESEFKNDNDNHFNNNDIINSIEEAHSLLKLVLWLKTPNSEFTSVMKALDFEYEHVLPRNRTLWLTEYEHWKVLEDKIEDEYLDKIGNIILIHKSLNVRVSNQLFEDKITLYLESEVEGKENEHYIFTRNLSLENDLSFLKGLYDIEYGLTWDANLIKQRTEKITNLILDTLKENY